ncbi:segregation and condensation protein B [Verrucomicrobium sp. GAS474]|uniref:SMC-Scp complex subunit ScpB n=1 Tax=Verrucomicrobium sp. GAS474 TaxID=1882831 RepID=UPI00087D2F3C|nr:SMC-Scp complex subunit ScpB [Verrucomicrobium sp. GAS474]SDT86225.1 segregation and condensation protein B [Verrucomicrobium sp. GAS474]
MTDDVLPPESDIPANTDTVLDIDAAAPESDGADAASTPDPGSLPLSSETFTPSGPVPADLRQVVEALIFASSKALTARQLLNILTRSNETHGADFHLFKEVTEDQILDVIVQLKEEYATAVPSRGLHLQQIAGGFRFGTRPETATWVRQLFDETRPAKLSQPALETLSIIAYRQPISRADVEAVRGVAIDGVVSTLLERRLIKLAGRSEAPGRPLLYETTPEFLETFGLKALDELPNADELRRIPLPVQTPAKSESESESEAKPEAETAAATEVQPDLTPETATETITETVIDPETESAEISETVVEIAPEVPTGTDETHPSA